MTPDLDDLFDEPDPLGPPPARPSSRPSIEEVEAVANSMAVGMGDPDELQDEPVHQTAVRRAGPDRRAREPDRPGLGGADGPDPHPRARGPQGRWGGISPWPS